MNNFKSFMEKLKKNMLVYIVVWLMLAILLVAPITYTYTNAQHHDIASIIEECTVHLVDNVLSFPILKVFETKYINDFMKGLGYFSLGYVIILYMSISKSLPNSKYQDIEHGSSDWCENGEQYRVLSKKNGIILAKNNYLPIDKTGNVNVLIVGRIWCW